MDPALFHPSPARFLLCLFCAFLIGFSKSGIAGTGTLAIPLMAGLFPAGPSTGILLPILIAGDVFALVHYRRHAEWRFILRALPWAVAGILAGWAAVRFLSIPDAMLRRLIGATVLGMLVLGLQQRWRTAAPEACDRPLFSAAMGLLGGVTTMMANAAGPVWNAYLLALRLPKEAFLGTAGWMFFILNSFKVPWSVDLGFITPDSLWFNLKMLPAVWGGAWLGFRVARRIPQGWFDLCVLALTALAAGWLLF